MTRIHLFSFLASIAAIASSQAQAPLGFSFVDVGREAGLIAPTVYGGQTTNRFLLETTGCGVAAFDYDNDGWLDLFFVNGTTLEGFPRGKEPTSHLYRNRGNGTFEDVTARAGLSIAGWGQGACAGDYDNDGFDDLYVTLWGQNRLFRNRGNGTFEDVTERAGLLTKTRWGAGCAFLDADRDGLLDLFAANYIDFDLKTAPVPESGLCRYKGIPVACGPPGLTGGKNLLYRNTGRGTFADISEAAGITRASGTYGLGVSTLDFDDDGWTDVYVANDSNPSTLYRNRRDGTFEDVAIRAGCAFSQDGKPQAGMGLAIGDYDRNGTFDIFKTNFAGDTSTLYANTGDGLCEDRTFASGVGINTRSRVGRRLPRRRSRRLARPVPRERPRLSGSGRSSERVPSAQGLYQPAERAIRGRDRTTRGTADDAAAGPGRGVRRFRQRWRRRRRGVNVNDTPNLYWLDVAAGRAAELAGGLE